MLRQFIFEMSRLGRDYNRKNSYLRISIILTILLLAIGFGSIARQRLLETILLSVAAGLFLLIILGRIEWLLLMTIPVSFFIPVDLDTGTNVRINVTFVLSLIFIAIWMGRLFLIEKRVTLVPSIVNRPAILFIIATTLSLIAGNLSWSIKVQTRASLPAQMGGWALYTISIITFLAISNQVKSINWLKKMVGYYILISGPAFIALLIPWISANVSQMYVPVSLSSTTRIWLTSLAFGQLLWRQKATLFEKIGLGLCTFCPVIQSWLYDREFLSGWIAPLISIFVLIWLRSWRWGRILTVLGILLVVANYQDLFATIMTPTQIYSTESRMATWPVMFELIKFSPLLGLGPANYPYYTHLFPIFGYYIRFNSHNNYFDILAQTGILGLLSFIWLAITIGWLGWRLREKVREPFTQGYVNGALAGFVSTLIAGFMADWFLPFLYNVGFSGFRASFFVWFFLGGLVSLEHIVDNKNKMIT